MNLYYCIGVRNPLPLDVALHNLLLSFAATLREFHELVQCDFFRILGFCALRMSEIVSRTKSGANGEMSEDVQSQLAVMRSRKKTIRKKRKLPPWLHNKYGNLLNHAIAEFPRTFFLLSGGLENNKKKGKPFFDIVCPSSTLLPVGVSFTLLGIKRIEKQIGVVFLPLLFSSIPYVYTY